MTVSAELSVNVHLVFDYCVYVQLRNARSSAAGAYGHSRAPLEVNRLCPVNATTRILYILDSESWYILLRHLDSQKV